VSDGKAFVYAIQHSATGKIYVGCTNDVERRIHQHITQLSNNKHPNKRMQDDFNNFGGDYFYYVLFKAYAAYDAFMMERIFMSLLDTRNEMKGYNTEDNSKNFSLDNYKRVKIQKPEKAKPGNKPK
jgi:group I intron endonuclease